MPSSRPAIISPVMEMVQSFRPKTALDIGIGFGKWGFLLREYLDAWYGRIDQKDWEARIDGVEAFPNYVTGLQQRIYDKIYQTPIEFLVEMGWLGDYDLILMAEVIEHLDKEVGKEVLRWAWEHCKYLIVTTPTYESGQGETNNNPYEKHKSLWSADLLKEVIGHGEHKIIQHRYLIFWARKD